jgi:hypothetical protein
MDKINFNKLEKITGGVSGTVCVLAGLTLFTINPFSWYYARKCWNDV